MFYLKIPINNESCITAEITDENVFSRCPKCGKEHAVDLQEVLGDGESDLFGTQVYCADCSKEMARAHL